MNAPAPTDTGIAFTEHPKIPDWWIVTVDGDTRIVTKDGNSFIAWIGSRSPHWSFQGALDACAEDVRYQAFLRAEAQAKADTSAARIAGLSDAEREAAVVSRETEIALLAFSDAHNWPEREARLRADILLIGGQ